MIKIQKLFYIFQSKVYIKALKYSVAACIEHENLLKSLGSIKSVVDIGANKGQFSLTSRRCFPGAKIFAFEPLSSAATIFNRVFKNDSNIKLYNFAIGAKKQRAEIHISNSEDSSSLLPISKLQNDIFPGTFEVRTEIINVERLDSFITSKNIAKRSLLKIDVQGFEIEVLKGCHGLLNSFNFVYCECSFVELYSGQSMACDVVEFLRKEGFILKGVYNTSYNKQGLAIQADMLFESLSL
jgi:FkbM family methyltransferase